MVAIVVVQRHEVITNPSINKAQTNKCAVLAHNCADLGDKCAGQAAENEESPVPMNGIGFYVEKITSVRGVNWDNPFQEEPDWHNNPKVPK